MSHLSKISLLWHYFKIRDNETLIIPSYNHEARRNEYIITKRQNNKFVVNIVDILPDLSLLQPFKLLQHRDSNGQFIIPSVKQIIKDEEMDNC